MVARSGGSETDSQGAWKPLESMFSIFVVVMVMTWANVMTIHPNSLNYALKMGEFYRM